MPLSALVIVVIAVLGCALFLIQQVRIQARRRRNLRHWEKDEPLENAGDWD